MATSFFPAPCYLATNRGFYCGDGIKHFNNLIIFTGNIRKATVFPYFAAAEDQYKQLIADTNIEIAPYFAVVAALQAPISSGSGRSGTTDAAMLNPVLKLSGKLREVKLERPPVADLDLHPADCTCYYCLTVADNQTDNN